MRTTDNVKRQFCWFTVHHQNLKSCYFYAGAELERITKLMLCFTSYTQHGGNAILVLTDFALNDISIHPYLFGWVGLWSVTFGAWAILWYRLSGEWLYPFINYTKPWAPVAYIGAPPLAHALTCEWSWAFALLSGP